MARAFIWLIITYATFKFAAMVSARNPGFKRTGVRLRDRLVAKEPALFLGAFLLSVPLALLTGWYGQRHGERLYDHATGCYGQMMALKDVPAFKAHVDGYTLYERVESDRELAYALAKQLGIARDDVTRTLADKVRAFTDQYAAPQGPAGQREALDQIVMARRCLLPPGADPDG